jgi:hypothetical protein
MDGAASRACKSGTWRSSAVEPTACLPPACFSLLPIHGWHTANFSASLESSRALDCLHPCAGAVHESAVDLLHVCMSCTVRARESSGECLSFFSFPCMAGTQPICLFHSNLRAR